MSGIFICYRRQDTAYIAGRLHDTLAVEFGAKRVFRDIDTLTPGVDYVTRIDDAVGSSAALIAVIGNDWLAGTDTMGRRRIDNPRDWVRLEIAAALKRGILVVPVLVEQARMPAPQELPSSVRKLARLNALELTDARWDYDVQQLITALKSVADSVPPLRIRAPAGVPRPAPRPSRDPGVRLSPPSRPVGVKQARDPVAPSPEPVATRAEPVPPPPVVAPPAPQPRPWADVPATPPPAARVRIQPGRPSIPGWAKMAIPVAIGALLVSVLAVLAVPRGGGKPVAAASPTTTTPFTPPTTRDDPERPYAFSSLPDGRVAIGGKVIAATDLEAITTATAVPRDQLLQFGGDLKLTKRARNQLQFAVNQLGAPAPAGLDVVTVAGPAWDEDPSKPPEDRRGLRVGVLLRNGYTRSGVDPAFRSHLYCRPQHDVGAQGERLLAESDVALLATAGYPIIPPGASLYVELRYSGPEIREPALDPQAYKFCRQDPSRLTG